MAAFALKVEPFAGSDVKDIAFELCQLADRTGVLCEARLNGVCLWSHPGDNPLWLVAAFESALRNPGPFKLAQAGRQK